MLKIPFVTLPYEEAVLASSFPICNLTPLPTGFDHTHQNGQFILEPLYDLACIFSNGLARVRNGAFWGFINWKGQYVIDLQNFDFAHDFVEGLARIRVESNMGYTNKSEHMVILPQFDWAGDFSEGLAAVRIGVKSAIQIEQDNMIMMLPNLSSTVS